MSDDTGRTLEPTKLDVNKFRRSKVTNDAGASTPDQFGQSYNADYDVSKWSQSTPAMVRKLHLRADTDLSPRSLHHTLGNKHAQASPGDHIHDGTSGKKIGPLEMNPAIAGKTRAAWTIPVAPTLTDVVNLLKKFVEFRQV
jgi:hypothetical protein